MKGFTIQSRILPFRDYCEYYITITDLCSEKKSLENYFRDLERNKIRIVKVVYAGDSLMVGKYIPKKKEYPTLVIGNSQAHASWRNASIFIHGVAGNITKFRYIKTGAEITGTYFATKIVEFISLSDIRGSVNLVRGTFEKQAIYTYKNIDRILSRYRFPAHSIYRFWNYLVNISEDYTAFNAIRDQYYKKHSITLFPAATGIEAGLGHPGQICIGFEAQKTIVSKGIVKRAIASDIQSEAWAYGPKFPRAMLVEFPKEGIKKLYISGTSSVDKNGKSIYCSNYNKNIPYVLSSVEHLLKKNDMNFGNLLTSIVYCKNLDVQQAFERLYAEKKWNFPYNLVITNICRNDLVFEMECIAANKAEISSTF